MSSPPIELPAYNSSYSVSSNSPYISTTVGCGTTWTGTWGNLIQTVHDYCLTCFVAIDKESDETLYIQRSWHCSAGCFYQFLLNTLGTLDEIPQDG